MVLEILFANSTYDNTVLRGFGRDLSNSKSISSLCLSQETVWPPSVLGNWPGCLEGAQTWVHVSDLFCTARRSHTLLGIGILSDSQQVCVSVCACMCACTCHICSFIHLKTIVSIKCLDLAQRNRKLRKGRNIQAIACAPFWFHKLCAAWQIVCCKQRRYCCQFWLAFVHVSWLSASWMHLLVHSWKKQTKSVSWRSLCFCLFSAMYVSYLSLLPWECSCLLCSSSLRVESLRVKFQFFKSQVDFSWLQNSGSKFSKRCTHTHIYTHTVLGYLGTLIKCFPKEALPFQMNHTKSEHEG